MGAWVKKHFVSYFILKTKLLSVMGELCAMQLNFTVSKT